MSLIQMGEIVDCLNTQPVDLVLPGTDGFYETNGRWVKGTDPVTLPGVRADIQPATGRALLSVPEGERTNETVEVILTTHIDTVSEPLQQRAVKMHYRGLVWKCVGLPEDWRENGFLCALFQNTKQAIPAQGIAVCLTSRVQARALMQYVRVLAGQADIDGVDLNAADSPLLQ